MKNRYLSFIFVLAFICLGNIGNSQTCSYQIQSTAVIVDSSQTIANTPFQTFLICANKTLYYDDTTGIEAYFFLEEGARLSLSYFVTSNYYVHMKSYSVLDAFFSSVHSVHYSTPVFLNDTVPGTYNICGTLIYDYTQLPGGVGCPSTAGTESITLNNNLSVYPNPVINELNIQTVLPEFMIEVYDITGRVVSSQMNVKRLNLEELHSGSYFIAIRDGVGTLRGAKKFIKQ